MIKLRVKDVAQREGVKSPKELSVKTGLYYQSCWLLWQGKSRMIGLDTIEVLCRALGVRPNQLFDFDPELGGEPLIDNKISLKGKKHVATKSITTPNVSTSDEILKQINKAKSYEEVGKYEASRVTLAKWWEKLGEEPLTEGLEAVVAAELLLRAGSLTGWLGSSHQLSGYQEVAKNLITKAFGLFENLGMQSKCAECLSDLAWCYWREGAFDEARVTLKEALDIIQPYIEYELSALIKVRLADVERAAFRLNEALTILTGVAPQVEKIDNHSLKGKFHNTLAVVLKNLGASEKREDYFDRSLVEFTAASYHFEQCGHKRYQARVENNIGLLLIVTERFNDAHEHLRLARELFISLKDKGSVAQVEETIARTFISQQKYRHAVQHTTRAIQILNKGDEQALLAEALITHGVALARLGEKDMALKTLKEATQKAEIAGDREGWCRALLSILEELKGTISEQEFNRLYLQVKVLLSDSQHLEAIKRFNKLPLYL